MVCIGIEVLDQQSDWNTIRSRQPAQYGSSIVTVPNGDARCGARHAKRDLRVLHRLRHVRIGPVANLRANVVEERLHDLPMRKRIIRSKAGLLNDPLSELSRELIVAALENVSDDFCNRMVHTRLACGVVLSNYV